MISVFHLAFRFNLGLSTSLSPHVLIFLAVYLTITTGMTVALLIRFKKTTY